jgi:hypothetical protein
MNWKHGYDRHIDVQEFSVVSSACVLKFDVRTYPQIAGLKLDLGSIKDRPKGIAKIGEENQENDE